MTSKIDKDKLIYTIPEEINIKNHPRGDAIRDDRISQ